jgi:capsular exopolysaccharide synthesis family protein
LESNLKAPIIGNIGHNNMGTELPVNENPRSSLTESFRALRTNLHFILSKPEARVITVSSAVSGEGKTFISVNLASILAMAGKKTLLVSLDLRRPKVHKVFKLENKIGMSTYLIGKNSFNEILSETNISNLVVATSGPVPPNPAELLNSEKMSEFISKAREKFDFIVLDTPPVAIVSDTMILKELLDAYIFVIRHNYSNKHVINMVNHIYSDKLIRNTCTVVNDIQIKGYYGYSYRYEYGYSNNYGYDYYGDQDKKRGFFNKLFLK